MKKLIFTLIIALCITPMCAQSSSDQYTQKELYGMIEKMQKKIDFLSCQHRMDEILLSLKDLQHSLRLDTFDVDKEATMYKRFTYKMYELFSANYNSQYELYESYSTTVRGYRKMIDSMVDDGCFTNKQYEILISGYDLMKSYLASIENELSIYNKTILTYKSVLNNI